MTNTLIRIENLSKTFLKQPVLKNLNLTLSQGQMIGIVGPDGAGKTTLMRLIAGLLTPTIGTIEVLGHSTLSQAEKIHEISSYMPQRFGLYEDLTVLQNLELYAALKGSTESFEPLLKFTGLSPFLDRRAMHLSGGMKQKLGLACTLIQKPKLLILDEATVGVDPISRQELWKMVYSLLAEGVSVLWSTAYLNEAEKCQTIVLLNEGELLYVGPPAQFTKRVQGRVFSLEEPNRREKLAQLENQDDVIDALIQGNHIRVVAKTSNFPQGKPIEPRLEDAFVDVLFKQKSALKLSAAAPTTASDQKEEVLANDLVKKFGSFTAVDHISFSIKKGEIFGLLGPNGAGKSTTFKMLCGLLKPTQGQAKIGQIDLQKEPNLARSKLGYMAQKFSLYGNLTVKQNLEFFAGVYQACSPIQQIVDLSDLSAYQHQTTDILPAGIKQKLALAVSLLHWPELLFLDEPTSGMDPISRRHFWAEMNGLARKGKTILVSTHFMDEAENCDRLGLIYRGKVIHLDTPDRIKALAQSDKNPHPSLEDAFIQLIEAYDAKS